MLQTIKRTQEEQHEILQQICLLSTATAPIDSPSVSSASTPCDGTTESPRPLPSSSPSEKEIRDEVVPLSFSNISTLSFEAAFIYLVNVFGTLDLNYRVTKIHQLLSHLPHDVIQNVTHFTEVLNEVLCATSTHHLSSSSLHVSPRQPQQHRQPLCSDPQESTMSSCTCVHCPYEERMIQFDECCSDFLTSESLLQSVAFSNELIDWRLSHGRTQKAQPKSKESFIRTVPFVSFEVYGILRSVWRLSLPLFAPHPCGDV